MEANSNAGVKRREWMRIALPDAVLLSLPVEGGASALKNGDPERWTLAPEAARDLRKAAATLATLLGRRPFFHLLEQDLRPVAAGKDPVGMTARAVCSDAFAGICGILGLEDPSLLDGLSAVLQTNDSVVRRIAADFNATVDPDVSIIEPVVAYGPDAIFTLLPPF